MVTADELTQIQRRMAEAGITNAGAYMRKMALNGYILHVDLAPVKELVSLQRRCANNLNQVAVHANTFGVYPEEIAALQKDYAALWEPLSDLLTIFVKRATDMSCHADIRIVFGIIISTTGQLSAIRIAAPIANTLCHNIYGFRFEIITLTCHCHTPNSSIGLYHFSVQIATIISQNGVFPTSLCGDFYGVII